MSIAVLSEHVFTFGPDKIGVLLVSSFVRYSQQHEGKPMG